MRRSRFADVVALSQQTLSLGADAGALYDLGWASQVTGHPVDALSVYEQALALCRDAGDRPNEAITLNNIGGVYDGLGELGRALDCYEQALSIAREVGDRAGEAAR